MGKTGLVSMVAAFGMGSIDPSKHPNLAVLFKRCQDVVVEFRIEAEHIKSNEHLSKEGKVAQLAQLGVTAMGRLDFEKLLNDQRNTLTLFRDALKFEPRDPDNAARAMREWEVRDRLMDMTQSVRTSIFIDAVRDGDTVVFDAVRNAPGFLRILPPDTIKAGETEWLMKRDPENAQKVNNLADAIKQVEQAQATARSIIRNEAGIPADKVTVAVGGAA